MFLGRVIWLFTNVCNVWRECPSWNLPRSNDYDTVHLWGHCKNIANRLKWYFWYGPLVRLLRYVVRSKRAGAISYIAKLLPICLETFVFQKIFGLGSNNVHPKNRHNLLFNKDFALFIAKFVQFSSNSTYNLRTNHNVGNIRFIGKIHYDFWDGFEQLNYHLFDFGVNLLMNMKSRFPYHPIFLLLLKYEICSIKVSLIALLYFTKILSPWK